MKLAIIGSRTCPPVDIEAYLKYIPDTIVSGGAKGADTYAREFARKKGLVAQTFRKICIVLWNKSRATPPPLMCLWCYARCGFLRRIWVKHQHIDGKCYQ